MYCWLGLFCLLFCVCVLLMVLELLYCYFVCCLYGFGLEVIFLFMLVCFFGFCLFMVVGIMFLVCSVDIEDVVMIFVDFMFDFDGMDGLGVGVIGDELSLDFEIQVMIDDVMILGGEMDFVGDE